MDRRKRILERVDVTKGCGLEIGPLASPIVSKTEASVLYVDHATTAELETKYGGDPAVGAIVDVDLVWDDGPLDQVLGDRAPVSWIVASHVVEHVPDLVGWLGELAAVLVPGGLVSLAVPDRRYSFDAKRRDSELSDVVAASLSGARRPSLSATFDFWSKITPVDTERAWTGQLDLDAVPDDDVTALAKTRAAHVDPAYRDVHRWVFTPASFADVLRRLFKLDLVPWFEVVALVPTSHNELEFYVTLRRLPDDLDHEHRRHQQAASLPQPGTARAALDVTVGDSLMVLSTSERRVVLLKRKVFTRLRALLRRS